MRLNPTKLAFAAALATAITWILCSLFVLLSPELGALLTSSMLHTEEAMVLQIKVKDVLIGGAAWMLLAFVLVWISTFVYQLIGTSDNDLT